MKLKTASRLQIFQTIKTGNNEMTSCLKYIRRSRKMFRSF